MEIEEFEKKLTELPWPAKVKIALKLPLNEIINLCLTSKIFNEEICNFQYFWRKLYKKYYKFSLKTDDWRKAFRRMSLFTFGSNRAMQLGTGDIENRYEPTRIMKAKFVACGGEHTLVIDLNNEVYSFGNWVEGQLGVGTYNGSKIPQKVYMYPNTPFKAKYAAAGYRTSFLIDLDNNIWAFGRNEEGQLGLGGSKNFLRPTKTKFQGKAVACARNYTLIIDLEDNVWGFGKNKAFYYIPEKVKYSSFITRTPSQIGIKAKQIACGINHSLILDLEDNVWGFGDNLTGMLGIPGEIFVSELTPLGYKADYIACGDYAGFFIKDGDVWSFGDNREGQLGLGDIEDVHTPTQMHFPVKIEAIAGGAEHTLFLDSENDIWVTGNNEFGQIGLGVREVRTPVYNPDFKAIQIATGEDFSAFIGFNI